MITRKEIHNMLGQHFHIPHNVRDICIKELESMKIIEKIECSNYKILNPKLDLERDANKLFRLWNIF